MKVIPFGGTARAGIQSCSLFQDSCMLLLTFEKTHGSTLLNKHHQPPVTSDPAVPAAAQGSTRKYGSLYRGGGNKLATSKTPRSRNRWLEIRWHGAEKRPTLAAFLLGRPATSCQRTYRLPPDGADSATAAAIMVFGIPPSHLPQSPEATRQTLTRASFRRAGGWRHGGTKGTQGPGPRLQSQPRVESGGRHGCEDGKPDGTSAVGSQGTGLRPLPRRFARSCPAPRVGEPGNRWAGKVSAGVKCAGW